MVLLLLRCTAFILRTERLSSISPKTKVSDTGSPIVTICPCSFCALLENSRFHSHFRCRINLGVDNDMH